MWSCRRKEVDQKKKEMKGKLKKWRMKEEVKMEMYERRWSPTGGVSVWPSPHLLLLHFGSLTGTTPANNNPDHEPMGKPETTTSSLPPLHRRLPPLLCVFQQRPMAWPLITPPTSWSAQLRVHNAAVRCFTPEENPPSSPQGSLPERSKVNTRA